MSCPKKIDEDTNIELPSIRTPGPPKIWKVIDGFKKVGDKSIPVKIVLQELPEDRFEDALDHMLSYFVVDEPCCSSLKVTKDPVVLQDFRNIWTIIMRQGLTVVAFGENAEDGKPEIAGLNVLGVEIKDDDRKVDHYKTEQFTVLWLLFAVIVAGNTAVLAGLLLGKRRKSRMDFFIKQLAFADLLVGLISVLTDIIWRTTVTWHAGNIACKLIRFMQAVVTYSSTYVLVALSIDRYDAITRPMNFSGSWWRARVLVVAAWGLSALFSVPIIFLYEEKRIQGMTQCWIDLGSPIQWRIYMSLVSFTLFIAPTLIIGGCYTVIVATIWSQGSALRQGPTRDTRRASSRGLIPRAKIKTVKMTFVIVFVFILCWSPYIVFDLLQVYGHVPKTQTNIAVATFIQSLTPLNSAANPIIYCLFSTAFCKNVRNMQAISWVSGWCTKNPHHCFGTGGGNASTRTTVTTSLTAHSSRRSGLAMLHSAATRNRVMVSLV